MSVQPTLQSLSQRKRIIQLHRCRAERSGKPAAWRVAMDRDAERFFVTIAQVISMFRCY